MTVDQEFDNWFHSISLNQSLDRRHGGIFFEWIFFFAFSNFEIISYIPVPLSVKWLKEHDKSVQRLGDFLFSWFLMTFHIIHLALQYNNTWLQLVILELLACNRLKVTQRKYMDWFTKCLKFNNLHLIWYRNISISQKIQNCSKMFATSVDENPTLRIS